MRQLIDSLKEFHDDELEILAGYKSFSDEVIGMSKAASIWNPYKNNPEVATAKNEFKGSQKYFNELQQKYFNELQNGNLTDEEFENQSNIAHMRFRQAKDKYKKAKLTVDMQKQTKKSPNQLKLEEQYKSTGMNPAEAELKAFQTNRFKNRLKLGVGAAAVIGGGIGAYKYHDYATDKTIKTGTRLKHMHAGDRNPDYEQPFYEWHTKKDDGTYKGLLGKQKADKNYPVPPKITELETTKDIKIPSRKNQKKMFKEFMQADTERTPILERILQSEADSVFLPDQPKLNKTVKRAQKKLKKGVLDNDAYDVLNRHFLNSEAKSDKLLEDKVRQPWFNEVKNKGYDAIMDSNDRIFSGYNSKANIVISPKDNVKVVDSATLPHKEINKRVDRLRAKYFAKAYAKQVGVPASLGFATIKAGNGLAEQNATKRQSALISKYREENPNENLSDQAIIEKLIKRQAQEEKVASLLADQFMAATSLTENNFGEMDLGLEILAGYKSFSDELRNQEKTASGNLLRSGRLTQQDLIDEKMKR